MNYKILMGSLVIPLHLICSLESLIKNAGNLYTFGLGRKLRRPTTDWLVGWTASDCPLPSTPTVAPRQVSASVCLSSAHHLHAFSVVRVTAGTELSPHIPILYFYPALMWIAISELKQFRRLRGVHAGNVVQPWGWALPSPQPHRPAVPALGCQQCPRLLLPPPQRTGPGVLDPFPESRCFFHVLMTVLCGVHGASGQFRPSDFVQELCGFHLPIIIFRFLYL